ncbi:MAG: ANTAR domain-containing protein [Streptomyces sp.]|uniref:ANTAR domain-containing protein n=1 Tax=Streptomyces sp. TaxID=1931 RepID=UPI0025D74D13|nr:ANTAR domain-containing protein [Streptomyces sp.]MBW8792820.1 ANTAR domain-containing protein [Streptomyces sp.]
MLEPSDEVPYASGGSGTRSPRSTASLRTRSGPAGARVTVAASGEFRLDDSQRLQHVVRDALARSTRGVDLDLGRLTLADGSALNVLLAMRAQAVAAGKTVAVTAVSPAVERLLTFTDTYSLFSSSCPPPEEDEPQDAGTDDGVLQTEVVQLRRAMRTRPDIDLARGILMASFGLTADAAWEVLVTVSQNINSKLHRLATDLVATVQGEPLPRTVQRQLTTAVATARRADVQPQEVTRGEPTAVCQERGSGSGR